MRTASRLLLVGLCLTNGCITAIRQTEKALRRGNEPQAEKQRDSRTVEAAVDPRAADLALKTGHPRLMLTAAGFPDADATTAEWRNLLRRRADETLAKPPIDYSPRRLLTRSREALRRVTLLAGVYRITKEQKYADAGRRELLNVCGFADWQPNDFLATAEMMTAVSVGYDWLFDALNPADRRTVVDTIARLGLTPALGQYASGGGWTTARHNWNLVCNGGVIVASLAIAEEQPDLARRALGTAVASVREGLAAYDPQGGTPEGPMYHNYATRYLTFAAAALDTAGTRPLALELLGRPDGWTHAGDFRLQMTGPTGKSANFGDGSEVTGNSAWMFWHAAKFARPQYAAFEADNDRVEPSVFDLLWYAPPAANRSSFKPLPLAAQFSTAITLRSGFEDAATFVALRTGSTADHHSHLDLGTFVLDMLGERFAGDLGADNYDLPGYLGKQRADYLRSSTPGHNTLTIGQSSQSPDATATQVVGGQYEAKFAPLLARLNMTEAYPGATDVTRTIELDGRVVTVTDQIQLRNPGSVTWHLHTLATVTAAKSGALLTLNGKQVTMTIVEPAGAAITQSPDVTRPPELPIDGITHVRITLPRSETSRVVVRFTPAK